jgi:hypothetical protein
MNKVITIKKVFLFCLVMIFFFCFLDSIMTEFYVKNTSNKTISFEASIIKFSQITDPYEISLSFTVPPNESVLARKTEFQKDGKEPQKWFTKFVIHPVYGVEMNDPYLLENWVKYIKNDTPVYEFTLNKN